MGRMAGGRSRVGEMWAPISANQAGSCRVNITHLHWTPVGPVFPAISHGIQPALMRAWLWAAWFSADKVDPGMQTARGLLLSKSFLEGRANSHTSVFLKAVVAKKTTGAH